MAFKRVYLVVLLVTAVGVMGITNSQAQKRIIQLSGVVLGEDSISGLPGAHVYVPKAGRGTSTQPNGFFSMPVLEGDSVVISSVGYHRRHYIVPLGTSDFTTIIIEMVTDNTFLKEVTILPFPTEEVFKQAVLALNVPMDNGGYDKRNLNAELMALMMQNTPMDGNLNYRYYMDQYTNSISDRSVVRTNPFLNPFNWARFYRDLKQKKKK
jgi:hypothetical protein